jgi:hypothetical protein
MPAFCFDTSAFVNPFRRAYPMDLFPSLWTALAERIERGDIVTSDVVRVELEQKDDELLAWFRMRGSQLVVPMDEDQQRYVTRILAAFPNWMDAKSTKNDADPFVVALALSRGLGVVSWERVGGPSRPGIPFVCDRFGVRHLSFFDYIRETKLRFSTV